MHRVTKRFLVSVVACATAAVGSFTLAPQHVVAAGAACTPTGTVDGDYSVLTFQATGSCTWTPPAGLSLVEVLVVGGGGGGGGGKKPSAQPAAAGGGGGGGQVTAATSVTVSAPMTVVVGSGGLGGAESHPDFFQDHPGAQGGTSSFGVLTAPGGVGGGGVVFPDETRWSGDGGNSGRSIDGIPTTTTGGSSNWDAAGGGAGSGANGSAGTDLPSAGGIGGDGGAGVVSSITGSSVIYGGGGGGGGAWDGDGSTSTDGSGGAGGTGGGGAGSQLPDVPATAGVDGRGGGGGGGGYTDNNASSAGAKGGSGVVIVRYLTAGNLVVTTAPGNTTVGGGLTAPVVQVQDGNGNAVALSGVTVSAMLTTGSGSLSNAIAVTNAAGSATFPDFGLSGAAGNYVVEFRANRLTAVTTPIRINPPFDPPSPPDTGGGSASAPETPQPTSPSPNEQLTDESPAPPPPLTPLPPGTSSALIGGTPVVAKEETVQGGRVVVVTAGPVEMNLRGASSSGQDIPLAPDGSLLLARSGDLQMSVFGLAPGSIVTKTLFSEPINLGIGTVDGAGTYSSTASIPSNVPLGTHTLRIQGATKANDPFTLDIGVTVATPAVALGASPKLTVRPVKSKGPSTLHVSIRAAQRGCMVTFKTRNTTVKARVSKDGRAVATIPSRKVTKNIQRVTARISGKGCAPVTVSR